MAPKPLTAEQKPPVPYPSAASQNDTVYLKLAREIAMDIREIPDILETHGVDWDRWERIRASPVFQSYLTKCMEEWASAANTGERVRLKSLAMVEETLPTFYERMIDPRETLPAKTEVLKTIAKFAGVGVAVDGALAGDRMTVTINLGSDHQVRIEKDVNPVTLSGNYEEVEDAEEAFGELASPFWDTDENDLL